MYIVSAAAGILISDLHNAWKYAVRALNAAENAELEDTRQAMLEIVGKISQQLEFHDAFDSLPDFTAPNN